MVLWTFIFNHGRWEYLYSNCSLKTSEEWRAESIPNVPLAILFIIMGIIFELLYIPILVVFLKPEFIKYSCYKFMLQLCIIDLIVIPCNAIFAGLQLLYGLHFCTNRHLYFITGCIGCYGWYAGSITCVILAIDRFFVMTWREVADFLFEGKRVYLWTSLTILYTLCAFFQPTGVFSTKLYAWLIDPFIGTPGLDSMPQFMDFTFLTIHNFIVVSLLGAIYTSLCVIYMSKFKSLLTVNISKNQKLLTLQALCICVEFFIAALAYVFMQFVPVPEWFIITGHICWIMLHGDTPIVYLILNKSLRKAVFRMIRIQNAVDSTTGNVYQHRSIHASLSRH